MTLFPEHRILTLVARMAVVPHRDETCLRLSTILCGSDNWIPRYSMNNDYSHASHKGIWVLYEQRGD